MANQLEPVVGRLVGDNTDYVRSLNDAERRTGGFVDASDRHFGRLGASVGKFAKVAALGLAGAAVGVGAFLKSAADAAEESRKVTAQTEAVIKSTGGAANVTAGQVGKLADSLAALTGIDDEVIASTENMLLTFTNVRNGVGKGNDIFNQATKTALDMSVALGTDSKDAALQLGKALNDPIKGVTALQRVGVTFTAAQKEQIKTLVESGRTMDAQKIILRELATEFGGSAEAAASPMARLKVVVGNLQEELGMRLLPVIGKVAGFLADKLPGALDAAGRGFQFLTAGFKDPAAVQGPANFLDVLFNLGAGVRTLVDQFKEWWPEIKATVLDAVDAIVGWVREHWPEIKRIITETMQTVQDVVSGVVDVLTTIWDNFGSQIKDVVAAAWRYVRDTIEGALNVIQGIVKVITGIIHGDWGQVWEGIKQIVEGAWEMIKARIDLALNIVKNIISVGMEIVKSIFSEAWNTVFEVTRNILADVVDFFLGAAEDIVNAAATAFGWIPGIGPKLREAADRFAEFRDDVNNKIRGIDANIRVTADISQAWAQLDYLESRARATEAAMNFGVPARYRAAGGRLDTAAIGKVLGFKTRGPTLVGEGNPAYPEYVLATDPMYRQRNLKLFAEAASALGVGGSAVAGYGGGGPVTNNYYLTVATATGDIPDSTIRKIRTQLLAMTNDYPAGSILPAA